MFTLARPNVHRVVQLTFASFLAAADFALLKIGSRSELTIPEPVIDYFAAEYPGQFVFGTLERAATLPGPWWTKHLGSLLGNVEYPLLQVPSGFYLFHLGKAVGHHSGSRDLSEREAINTLKVAAVSALVDLALSTTKLTSSLADSEKRKDLDALIRHFEPLIQERRRGPRSQEDRGGSAFSDGSGKRRAPEKEPDPYEVLGVLPTATELEVKRAHRDRILENHPDRVAKMSAAIRQLAEQETKKINGAYERIKLERRWTDTNASSDVPAPEDAGPKQGARTPPPATNAAEESVAEKAKAKRAPNQRGKADEKAAAAGGPPKRLKGSSGKGSRSKRSA